MRSEGITKIKNIKRPALIISAFPVFLLMLFFIFIVFFVPGTSMAACFMDCGPTLGNFAPPVPSSICSGAGDQKLRASEKFEDPQKENDIGLGGDNHMENAPAPELVSALASAATYGNSASAAITGPGAPGEDSKGPDWSGEHMLPDRKSLLLEKDRSSSPGPPPLLFGSDAKGPGRGVGMGHKMWKPSDQDTIFYSASGNYNFPHARLMDEGSEIYDFNTMWKYETTRLAPVVMDAQATGGYYSGNNTIPVGVQVQASDNELLGKKATITGSYGFNTVSNDLDSITPVVHRFGGSVVYRLNPKMDVNGSAAFVASDFVPNDGHVYQGGFNWRPSVADTIASTVRLMETGPLQGYDIFASYQRKLTPATSVSFNSGYNVDLFHFIHERLTLSYAWKWGKYLINTAYGTTMDQVSSPDGMIIGRTCTVNISRSFDLPMAGIF